MSGKLIRFSKKNDRATLLEWLLLLIFFVGAWACIIWLGSKLYHRFFG